jgi:hypothetical protein
LPGRDDRITIAVSGASPHQPREVAMAKGQMRSSKEKKKPKADKGKPKQVSAYKLSQTQGMHTPHVTDVGAKKS